MENGQMRRRSRSGVCGERAWGGLPARAVPLRRAHIVGGPYVHGSGRGNAHGERACAARVHRSGACTSGGARGAMHTSAVCAQRWIPCAAHAHAAREQRFAMPLPDSSRWRACSCLGQNVGPLPGPLPRLPSGCACRCGLSGLLCRVPPGPGRSVSSQKTALAASMLRQLQSLRGRSRGLPLRTPRRPTPPGADPPTCAQRRAIPCRRPLSGWAGGGNAVPCWHQQQPARTKAPPWRNAGCPSVKLGSTCSSSKSSPTRAAVPSLDPASSRPTMNLEYIARETFQVVIVVPPPRVAQLWPIPGNNYPTLLGMGQKPDGGSIELWSSLIACWPHVAETDRLWAKSNQHRFNCCRSKAQSVRVRRPHCVRAAPVALFVPAALA